MLLSCHVRVSERIYTLHTDYRLGSKYASANNFSKYTNPGIQFDEKENPQTLKHFY